MHLPFINQRRTSPYPPTNICNGNVSPGYRTCAQVYAPLVKLQPCCLFTGFNTLGEKNDVPNLYFVYFSQYTKLSVQTFAFDCILLNSASIKVKQRLIYCSLCCYSVFWSHLQICICFYLECRSLDSKKVPYLVNSWSGLYRTCPHVCKSSSLTHFDRKHLFKIVSQNLVLRYTCDCMAAWEQQNTATLCYLVRKLTD